MLDADVVPVGTEFIGDNTCQRGTDVLPHLGLGDVNEDFAVTIHLEPNGG